jgi:hypothetical protein
VEESTTAQAKEEATSSLSARDVGASTILGTSARTDWKRRMMVVHLDRLALYQGAFQNERP